MDWNLSNNFALLAFSTFAAICLLKIGSDLGLAALGAAYFGLGCLLLRPVLQHIGSQGGEVQELQCGLCDVALLQDAEAVDAPRYRSLFVVRSPVELDADPCE